MGELTNILNEAWGRPKPTIHEVIFAVSRYNLNSVMVIDGDNLDAFMEYGDTVDLNEILTDGGKSLPKEFGVYSGDLEVQVYVCVCNHHEDPTEWDMTVSIDNIKKIYIQTL
jgi:hypothetical protein